MLTQTDTKYWQPNQKVLAYLKTLVSADAKVLDVGPGHSPLPWATSAVDFQEVKDAPCPVVKCDMSQELLPFTDKQFDFVYCRHVLEDMWNPFLLCQEMSRVGKSGYIEMPSPIAELARGVDGSSPPYRGYHHHRFIGWGYRDELRLITKYPFVEYLNLDEKPFDDFLRKDDGKYWNTYYLWNDKIKIKHVQNVIDYVIPSDYARVLSEACQASKEHIDVFFNFAGK